MRNIITITFSLVLSLPLYAADQPNSNKEIPDVETIVNKANVVAYYQGKDGKAHVKMIITNKQGQQREREFNILRKDADDGVYIFGGPGVLPSFRRCVQFQDCTTNENDILLQVSKGCSGASKVPQVFTCHWR